MYLTTVCAAGVDRRRESDDAVAVYVVPAAGTKTGVVPSTLWGKTMSNQDFFRVCY